MGRTTATLPWARAVMPCTTLATGVTKPPHTCHVLRIQTFMTVDIAGAPSNSCLASAAGSESHDMPLALHVGSNSRMDSDIFQPLM